MRGPSRQKSAGRSVSAIAPASGPTRAPAIPIERRNPSGKTASVAIAAPTVTELKATVRPAVRIVSRTASGARATPGQLLAVAGNEQQAVVDPEPEPGTGDDVERVGRHRREAVEHAQQQQRAEDGEPAADERQERRHHASEDQEREQEEDREGDQLGALQVLLHLVVDLHGRDRHAADRRARHRVHPPVDALRGLAPAPLRDARPRGRGHDRLAPVAGENRPAHRLEERLGADQCAHARDARARGVAYEHEHLRPRREPGSALDHRLGPQALAARGDELVRGAPELAGRGKAEGGRDHRERCRRPRARGAERGSRGRRDGPSRQSAGRPLSSGPATVEWGLVRSAPVGERPPRLPRGGLRLVSSLPDFTKRPIGVTITTRTLLIAGIIILVGWAVVSVRDALLIVFLGIFIGLVFEFPTRLLMERAKLGRGLAATIAVLGADGACSDRRPAAARPARRLRPGPDPPVAEPRRPAARPPARQRRQLGRRRERRGGRQRAVAEHARCRLGRAGHRGRRGLGRAHRVHADLHRALLHPRRAAPQGRTCVDPSAGRRCAHRRPMGARHAHRVALGDRSRHDRGHRRHNPGRNSVAPRLGLRARPGRDRRLPRPDPEHRGDDRRVHPHARHLRRGRPDQGAHHARGGADLPAGREQPADPDDPGQGDQHLRVLRHEQRDSLRRAAGCHRRADRGARHGVAPARRAGVHEGAPRAARGPGAVPAPPDTTAPEPG